MGRTPGIRCGDGVAAQKIIWTSERGVNPQRPVGVVVRGPANRSVLVQYPQQKYQLCPPLHIRHPAELRPEDPPWSRKAAQKFSRPLGGAMPAEMKGECRHLRAPLIVRGIATAVGGHGVKSVDPVRNPAAGAAPAADPADGTVGRGDPRRIGDCYVTAEDSTALGTERRSIDNHPRSACRSSVNAPGERVPGWCPHRRFPR